MERSAGSISDVRRYLLDDFGFQSRRHVLRVFKLCCLLVGEPNRVSPPFTLDLAGCKQAEGSVLLCCRVVQSYVLSDGYSPQSLFTESTMGLIRDAVSDAGLFYIGSDFNWTHLLQLFASCIRIFFWQNDGSPVMSIKLSVIGSIVCLVQSRGLVAVPLCRVVPVLLVERGKVVEVKLVERALM